MRHLIPLDDSSDHTEEEWCKCNPKVVSHRGEMLCLHHYFDNREIILQAELVMGIRCENCLEYIDDKGNHIPPPPPYSETETL